VPVIAIPAENEEILESLELLLHEIAAVESTSDQPEVIQEDEDITSALLESLLNGNFIIEFQLLVNSFDSFFFF
jgi:hypothetical protein